MISSAPIEWSTETIDIMTACGWRPDRRARALVEKWRNEFSLDGFKEMFPRAEMALLEFGGLKVHSRGRGIRCARCSIDFDPTSAFGAAEVFDSFDQVVGGRLYPIGDVDGGHAMFSVAETGAAYLLATGDTCDILRVGASVQDAIDNLIRGRDDNGAWIKAPELP